MDSIRTYDFLSPRRAFSLRSQPFSEQTHMALSSATPASPSISRVVVTGASSGLGLDIARRFLAEGSRVLMNARDPHKLARAVEQLGAPHGRALAVAGDIGDPKTARALAEAARTHLGGLDVVVNNGGIFGARPFLETTLEELDGFLTTNLKGTFLVTQALVPLLIEAGGGSVISIGTVLVDQPSAGLPAAAAMTSKGGVHALTRSLSAELAHHRVRVNAIAPGIIRTPLLGDGVDAMGKMALLDRVGEAHEISEAALYLARAAFVTGVVLDVDGGYAHGRR
jgi:NAD(P)-dependent dehydrogenase (short-subunit alcohol dehydrogenase family)